MTSAAAALSRENRPPVNDPHEVRQWSMYAWANHGWTTTVGTVLIGPWLLALATSAAGGADRPLFGLAGVHLSAAAFPSAVFTVSALAQVVVLPALGASADALAVKRRLLAVTCVAGSVIAALLATTGSSAWLYAGLLYLVGTVVFGANDVMYNALLPEIVTLDRRDAVSSRGYAVGYLGAGILLAVNLATLQLHGVLGLSQAQAVRLCYLTAGVWWIAFGLVAIRGLRERGSARTGRSTLGLRELRATLVQIWRMPQVFRYLLAYLFFTDAISAVVGLASTYLTHELYHDDAAKAASFLFELILLIQFVAVGGSLLFGWLARRIGTKNGILVALVLWCFVVGYAYAVLHTKAQAVAMGMVIAIVLGGSQALARSLYSQLIPKGREATFFGLYEICDRGTSWIAPLLFTVVVDLTGSFRQAILSLITLFVVGGLLLVRTDVDKARAQAAAG